MHLDGPLMAPHRQTRSAASRYAGSRVRSLPLRSPVQAEP